MATMRRVREEKTKRRFILYSHKNKNSIRIKNALWKSGKLTGVIDKYSQYWFFACGKICGNLFWRVK
jgi:hypothetical protein